MSRQRSIEKIKSSEYVTIGELVRLTETRYSTLKHYTEEGMLPFEQTEKKLTRRYNRVNTLKRLAEIKKMKDEGFSIPQIKQALALSENSK